VETGFYLTTFSSWRNNHRLKCPTVKWSGIQNVVEEAPSDVLLLLDCCNAGTANTNEGEGLTELISACAYNSKANGVGPYSFTHALVIELKELAKRPYFSVGELYGNIFCRIQARMPEDGTERHPAPVHLVLTNDTHYQQSIRISSRWNENRDARISVPNADATNTDTDSLNSSSQDSTGVKVPRLAFAIRLRDNFSAGELSMELFTEWLRTMPTIAAEVKVEAGFDSFSTLVIVSIPIYLSAYLPCDPAIISLGPVTSPNRVETSRSIKDHKAALDTELQILKEKFKVKELWEQDREQWEEDKEMYERSIRAAEARTKTVLDEFAAFRAVHQICQRPPATWTAVGSRDSAYSDTFSVRTMSSTASSSRLPMLNRPQRASNRSDLTSLSLAEEIAGDESEEDLVSYDGRTIGLPLHEGPLSKHYTALKKYLSSSPDSVGDEKAVPRLSRARDKLLPLSRVQFEELSADVFDELLRRHETDPPPYLQPRDHFHPKRNQARQKLSTLPPANFRGLAADIFYELERRFPKFVDRDTSQVDYSSPMQGPLMAPSVRGPPSSAVLGRGVGPAERKLQPMEEHPSQEVNAPQTGSFGQQSTDDGKRSFSALEGLKILHDFYPELLEAMKSPQDRGFLLSVEAKFISFVKDSNAPFLDLPSSPSSSSYIVLTEKLAQYYHLTYQGADIFGALRIFRTPFCRLPASLESIFSLHTAGFTPPPVPPPTMRAGGNDVARPSHLRASSETSYLSKKKYVHYKCLFSILLMLTWPRLSREEREAAYNKARERIFGKEEKTGDVTPGSARLSPTTPGSESPGFI
jgi:hypothetical protein